MAKKKQTPIEQAQTGIFYNFGVLGNYNFKRDKSRNAILGIKALGKFMIVAENSDNFFEVADIKYAQLLGVIYYHKPWKKFVWEQNKESIMSDRCLIDISNFISKLNTDGGFFSSQDGLGILPTII
jgi:hypothetical protein